MTGKTDKTAARKGPADSATLHPVGAVLPGSDGRSWQVIAAKAGARRWSPGAKAAAADGGCAPCALAAVALLGGAASPKLARKAPAPSASQFDVGTKKKGLDGHMWAVATNVRGAQRWKPAAKKPAAKKPAAKKPAAKKPAAKKPAAKK